MKKLFLVMAAFCLLFVSCNTKQVEAPVDEAATTHEDCQHNHEGKGCCGLTEEQKAMFAQWKQFETLEAQAQADLVAAMKAFLDEKMSKCEGEKHEGCQGEKHEGCQGEKHEGCQNKCEGEKDCAQKHAEMKEKWNNFENLAIEEQKALIDNVLEHQKKHAPKHEGCQGEKHEGCQGHNHEGCEGGSHEGCQGHNHEGCGNH